MNFVFKCNSINNAPILGELSYMLVNIGCFQLAFYPNDVSIWKTNIFRLGTLCAIMKSVEGLVYSLISLFFWYLLNLVSSIMCWCWYNLDNSLDFHSCEWLLGLIGVWCNLYLFWFLEVLCVHIYFMYTLLHAYFYWSNIYIG